MTIEREGGAETATDCRLRRGIGRDVRDCIRDDAQFARKTRVGTVVSEQDRGDKTVVVQVERRIAHPLYGKRVLKTFREIPRARRKQRLQSRRHGEDRGNPPAFEAEALACRPNSSIVLPVARDELTGSTNDDSAGVRGPRSRTTPERRRRCVSVCSEDRAGGTHGSAIPSC